jgi:hypothetical protein
MRYCHPQGILNNQYKCIVERRAIHRALLLVADGYIHGFVCILLQQMQWTARLGEAQSIL